MKKITNYIYCYESSTNTYLHLLSYFNVKCDICSLSFKIIVEREAAEDDLPDGLRGRVLPPAAHHDGHFIAAALAARILEGQRHGRAGSGRWGRQRRVGGDLDGRVAEVGRAVVALDHSSRGRRRRYEVSGHARSRLLWVVAVQQGQAERGEAGVGALAAVGAVEFFLEIGFCSHFVYILRIRNS